MSLIMLRCRKCERRFYKHREFMLHIQACPRSLSLNPDRGFYKQHSNDGLQAFLQCPKCTLTVEKRDSLRRHCRRVHYVEVTEEEIRQVRRTLTVEKEGTKRE